jgi:cation transport regulator ChaB
MPYKTVDELPGPLRANLPKHAQSIYLAAFNSAFDEYKGDEKRVHAVAWAAVKTKYHKDEKGDWVENVAKGGEGSGNFDHAGRPGEVGGSMPGGGAGGNSSDRKSWQLSVDEENAFISDPNTRLKLFGKDTVYGAKQLQSDRSHYGREIERMDLPQLRARYLTTKYEIRGNEAKLKALEEARPTYAPGPMRTEGDLAVSISDSRRYINYLAAVHNVRANGKQLPSDSLGKSDGFLARIVHLVKSLFAEELEDDAEWRALNGLTVAKCARLTPEQLELVEARLEQLGMDMPTDDLGKSVDFISKDAKRQVAVGVVYEPGVVDTQGDWATAEEIEKACHAYMETYRKTGLRHDGKARDDIIILENYIAPQDMRIGEQDVLKGAWVMGVKVKDAETWKQVESGELSGLSLFGKAQRIKGKEPGIAKSNDSEDDGLEKGSVSSGNFGHAGRPGEVGGSMAGTGGMSQMIEGQTQRVTEAARAHTTSGPEALGISGGAKPEPTKVDISTPEAKIAVVQKLMLGHPNIYTRISDMSYKVNGHLFKMLPARTGAIGLKGETDHITLNGLTWHSTLKGLVQDIAARASWAIGLPKGK